MSRIATTRIARTVTTRTVRDGSGWRYQVAGRLQAGEQHTPVGWSARRMRTIRGVTECWCHPSYVACGWSMLIVPTKASRERSARCRAAETTSDICLGVWASWEAQQTSQPRITWGFDAA